MEHLKTESIKAGDETIEIVTITSSDFVIYDKSDIPGEVIPYKEWRYLDVTNRGSYLFTDMRYVIYANGDGFFQITADGKDTTTFQRGGNTGPHFWAKFLNAQDIYIPPARLFLGEANYDACRGPILHQFPGGKRLPYEQIARVEVEYQIVSDRGCR